MRRLLYPGGALYTGDEIAAAVLEYARELARNETADTVFVPGRKADGEEGSVEFLLGPASQLVSEPLTLGGPEITDATLVSALHERAATLAQRRPGPQPLHSPGVG
jgi:hypothetical protein